SPQGRRNRLSPWERIACRAVAQRRREVRAIAGRDLLSVEMPATRVLTSQARQAAAAGDLTDACCSTAKLSLATSIVAAHHDAATSGPKAAARIRVPIFYMCRDRASPGNRPRRRAMPCSSEHSHAGTAAVIAAREV